MGGPQRHDTMGMTPAEEEAAIKKYKKKEVFHGPNTCGTNEVNDK
jgi:hypothetical protein